jgi:GT2 family glycosyltransferase
MHDIISTKTDIAMTRSKDASLPGIVVVARNERAHLRRTLENLRDTLPHGSDILVVDDGSTDGGTRFLYARQSLARVVKGGRLGVAGARNLGARRVKGSVLIFCDAHLWLECGWWEPLVARLHKPLVGGAAPVIVDVDEQARRGAGLYLAGPDLRAEWYRKQDSLPRRVPILPGACLAIRRRTLAACGGFDTGMICSGGVDNEFCLRLWLLGYEQWIEPRIEVAHLFRREQPYPIRSATILHNRLRLAMIHFSQERIDRVTAALQAYDGFPAALRLASRGNHALCRARWIARRVYDDDWFFRRFKKMEHLQIAIRQERQYDRKRRITR